MLRNQVDQLIDDIDSMKTPDTINTINECEQVLLIIRNLTKSFNDLPPSERKKITNIKKLNNNIQYFKSPEKRNELKTKLETQKKKKNKDDLLSDYTSPLRPEIINQTIYKKDEVIDNSEEEVFWEEDDSIEDYIRSDQEYVNPQLENIKKALEKRKTPIDQAQLKNKKVSFQKNSDKIKQEIEEMIREYRVISKEERDELSEVTQNNLLSFIDEDDFLLEGEESTPLYNLNPDEPVKENKINKIKKEQNKKNRLFNHKKEQLIKVSNHKYDNYYDDISPHDEVNIEKKKWDTATIIKSVALGLLAVGSIVITIIMVTGVI